MVSRVIRVFTRRAATDLTGWVLRGGVAAFFIMQGTDKFPSGPHEPWVSFFQQVGIGQWFRYFTGIVEIVGAILYFLPWTCAIGTFLLTCTMIGAITVTAMMGHPLAGFYPGIVLFALIAIATREPEAKPEETARRMFRRPG